jgi:hypothetical protein
MPTLQTIEADVYVRQATKALRSQPHLAHRGLQLACTAGRLELIGRVASYYEKQMAQETLRSFDGDIEIDNRLEVHWN